MKIKYEEIKKFMVDYCRDYTSYSQDEETMPKMNMYWHPDLKATAFMKLKGGEYPIKFSNRDEWEIFLIDGHLKIKEELIPKEIMIDMIQMKSGIVLCIRKYNRKDGSLLHEFDGFSYYNLIIDENKSLKMKTIDFYAGDPQTFTGLYNI
ncbi:MAG: hypothetical protein KAT34_21105 [Candidatus Aminicenantes bacterium]|nr:hypothetical protein [Candidatus Aminicenantes bacterium]